MSTGLLLSASCTTGWLDWVHGELWLTDTALVRRRLSLAETAKHDLGASVPAPVEAPLPLRLEPSHRTDKHLPLRAVTSAALRRGLLCDRLRVQLDDGARHTLLWLKADPASDLLQERLPRLLGDRFRLG